MESINGIPVVHTSVIIKPVLMRYGRTANDPAIREDILSDLRNAIASGNLELLRRFLSQDDAYWIGNLHMAYFQAIEGIKPLDEYEDWARAKCDLLIAIASRTKEDDGIIQHLVNYEDFHIEVVPFHFGPSFIVGLYELRGLDFFLFHYMGGETSAHQDRALFDHAESVVKSLISLGRTNEAKSVEQELEARKKRLVEIQRELQGPDYDPSANLLARIRISGERFWSEYLTPAVWTRVTRQSSVELVDASSTEYLLKQEILSTWSTVALALCKIIERETARAIFLPWKQYFQEASWTPPQEVSKTVRKRLESRLMTFKTLQACSSDKGHPPTLGQLVFVAKFWSDPLMDQCTDVFIIIRAKANRASPDFSERVAKLAEALQKPLIMNDAAMTIPDARNRSAHPREDEDVDWTLFIEHLKATLGKPPVELLKLLVGLTISANAAQRGVSADASVRRG